MSPDYVLGMDAKLYYGEAEAALGVLTELSNAKDVTVPLDAGETDVTTRANAGWRSTVATLRECGLEWEMVWKPADAGFIAIRNAFLNSTPLELAALDQDRALPGAQGPKGTFSITGFTKTEPLEETQAVAVTAKLVTFDEWITV